MSAGVLFSVIVPTYRRTEPLKRLLAALAQQDLPGSEFEVFIVDDGGGAPLEDLARPHVDSFSIRLLRQENAGPAAARNLGAAHARGRYLAFTDDDCRPESGWLSALDRAFASAPEALAGGSIVNGVEGNLFSEATELLFDYLYLRYNPVSVRGGFFLANNMAVPREAFLAVGGMDASMRFGEDREFCYRWASRGGGFQWVKDAVVRHHNELNLASFLKLHFKYGGGTASFRKRSRRLHLPPASISPPSWYMGLVLHGIRRSKGWRGVALAALLGTSQICSMGGLAVNALSNRALIR